MIELILSLIIITPAGPPVFCAPGQHAIFYAVGIPFDTYMAAEHFLRTELHVLVPDAFIECGCL